VLHDILHEVAAAGLLWIYLLDQQHETFQQCWSRPWHSILCPSLTVDIICQGLLDSSSRSLIPEILRDRTQGMDRMALVSSIMSVNRIQLPG
jgi:hypothetical protein